MLNNNLDNINLNLSERDTITKLIIPVLKDMNINIYTDLLEEVSFKGYSNENYRADILIYLNNEPFIVVEAKKNSLPATNGLNQAYLYSYILNSPFAISSNGIEYILIDNINNTETIYDSDTLPKLNDLINIAFNNVNNINNTLSENILDTKVLNNEEIIIKIKAKTITRNKKYDGKLIITNYRLIARESNIFDIFTGGKHKVFLFDKIKNINLDKNDLLHGKRYSFEYEGEKVSIVNMDSKIDEFVEILKGITYTCNKMNFNFIKRNYLIKRNNQYLLKNLIEEDRAKSFVILAIILFIVWLFR